MKDFTAEVKKQGKDEYLVLTVKMQKPSPSTTGKTLIVASTHGNVETDIVVDGKALKVGVNSYIRA
jgi:hypothetical protein